MNIGLLAIDSIFPNLALMKISSYHKSIGDTVEWYNPLCHYDKVYGSKIFSFSQNYQYYINADDVDFGGTGISLSKTLPDNIDQMRPDYQLYRLPDNMAMGFLTRGCPNKCRWCVVPEKEGNIHPYMDIEQIIDDTRNHAILMDNNILASEYGISQIEKIIRLNEIRHRKKQKKIYIDFNQGLDARLVTKEIADLLSKLKWLENIRFGCDTKQQVYDCDKAIERIDKSGYTGRYFLYCILLDDFEESFIRVNHWKNRGKRFTVHCQPYRDFHKVKQYIPQWQKDMAGWANKKEIFKSCEFKDFSPRKDFKCELYFKSPTYRL